MKKFGNSFDITDIKKIHLFSDLSDEELNKIRSFSTLKKLKKGDILFMDGDKFLGFYCILEGSVKLYKISSCGREYIVHLMHPYNTFAEVPVFESYSAVMNDSAIYPINSMAIEEDTVVFLVSAKHFLSFIRENGNICLKFLSTMSKRLKTLNDYIENITLHDVKRRLAKYIIDEFDKVTLNKEKVEKTKKIILKKVNYIELSISKNDLASHLGTILETLSRTLKKLQDEKIISVVGKKISILNLNKLKNYAK